MGLIISKFLKRNQIFGANKSGSQLSDVEDVMDSDEGGAAYNSGVNRRKSVFAEAYDPEQEEDDETETVCIREESTNPRPIVLPSHRLGHRNI